MKEVRWETKEEMPERATEERALCGRRQWHPTPVLLPGKSYGWKSLVGCSPWGCQEPDTAERLHFHFSLAYIGEGNGSPLQCSCLENPRDGGAWWAAVYGITQSWTRLKWLSRGTGKVLYTVHSDSLIFNFVPCLLYNFSEIFFPEPFEC